MEKDYSLLHPFDLEAAKLGEKICFRSGEGFRTFVAGHDSSGDFVLQCEKGKFHLCSNQLDGWKMAPLAWVEGRPVYNDSVMYRKDNGWICRYCHIGKSFQDAAGNWMDEAGFELTWQKPNTKREGWGAIPKNWVNETKENAEKFAAPHDDTYITVHAEWQE